MRECERTIDALDEDVPYAAESPYSITVSEFSFVLHVIFAETCVMFVAARFEMTGGVVSGVAVVNVRFVEVVVFPDGSVEMTR